MCPDVGFCLFLCLFIRGQLTDAGSLHIYSCALYLANKDKLCIQDAEVKDLHALPAFQRNTKWDSRAND